MSEFLRAERLASAIHRNVDALRAGVHPLTVADDLVRCVEAEEHEVQRQLDYLKDETAERAAEWDAA